MGIPFYFASLIRKHKNVLRRLAKSDKCVNLCLDSNSIVYDVVRSMKWTPETNVGDFEDALILAVCAKLDDYLAMVDPRRVYIAFDGTPPMAKMKQQRERRYKGKGEEGGGWDTVQITPGTTFMLRLDAALIRHFDAAYAARYEFFMLSTSAEPGEGEHKLFEWLRTAPSGPTFVYGLDSDLIILALHHLKFTADGIFMMREFKEEMKLLDVAKLATQIEEVVGAGKLFDYIFMVFFLGNDFLPHFPALNLRTKGFDTLMYTYAQVIPQHEHLYDGAVIQWKNVHTLVKALAHREERDVVREYVDRGKQTVEETLENTPRVRRELEHFINPLENGWEHRYYTSLMKMEPTKLAMEQVCHKFYEMLAWNAAYYTVGCPNWDVYYPYMYAPLLKDLEKYTPAATPVWPSSTPKTTQELLAFVLPREKHVFAPMPLTDSPQPKRVEQYWAFSTFLWESHLLFVF